MVVMGAFPTAIGTRLFVVVPSPRFPEKLAPQHVSVPLLSRAQVNLFPALTSTAVLIPDASTAGENAEVELLPIAP
jgi:hypothetical protein